MLGDELVEERRRQQRRVSGEDEHVLGALPHRLACGANGVARAECAFLHGDADVAEGVAALR